MDLDHYFNLINLHWILAHLLQTIFGPTTVTANVLSIRGMSWPSRNTRWPQRQRVQQLSDDVLGEKVYSLRRTRAGFLRAVTRVWGQIEPLLSDPNSIDTVRTLVQQYEISWKRLEESHNNYMSTVSSNSQEFYQMLQQFDQLHLEKTAFAQEISRYLFDAAAHLDEVNTRSHLKTEHVSANPKV